MSTVHVFQATKITNTMDYSIVANANTNYVTVFNMVADTLFPDGSGGTIAVPATSFLVNAIPLRGAFGGGVPSNTDLIIWMRQWFHDFVNLAPAVVVTDGYNATHKQWDYTTGMDVYELSFVQIDNGVPSTLVTFTAITQVPSA